MCERFENGGQSTHQKPNAKVIRTIHYGMESDIWNKFSRKGAKRSKIICASLRPLHLCGYLTPGGFQRQFMDLRLRNQRHAFLLHHKLLIERKGCRLPDISG
jgi:hypothetical protein